MDGIEWNGGRIKWNGTDGIRYDSIAYNRLEYIRVKFTSWKQELHTLQKGTIADCKNCRKGLGGDEPEALIG